MPFQCSSLKYCKQQFWLGHLINNASSNWIWVKHFSIVILELVQKIKAALVVVGTYVTPRILGLPLACTLIFGPKVPRVPVKRDIGQKGNFAIFVANFVLFHYCSKWLYFKNDNLCVAKMNPTTAKLVANVQIVLNKQLWMDSVFYFVVLYPHRILVCRLDSMWLKDS